MSAKTINRDGMKSPKTREQANKDWVDSMMELIDFYADPAQHITKGKSDEARDAIASILSTIADFKWVKQREPDFWSGFWDGFSFGPLVRWVRRRWS